MQVPHIGKVIAELLDPVLAEYYASQAYIRSQALATANAIVAPATPPRVSSTREALMAATSTPFSVEAWLKAISCDRYLDKFLELGYDNVLVLQELTDEDLNTLGIQLAGHRRTLLLAAQRLKEGADATATATTTTVAAAAAAVAAAAATPAPSISPPLLGKRRAAPGDTTTAKRRKITGSALVSVAPVALPAPTPAAATSPVWTGGDAGAAPTTPTTTTTNRSPREYIPRFRTGAWAVLVALHRMTTEAQKHFTQEEIIAVAEPYCDASFYKDFRDGHFWSAWDSTKTLFSMCQRHNAPRALTHGPPRVVDAGTNRTGVVLHRYRARPRCRGCNATATLWPHCLGRRAGCQDCRQARWPTCAQLIAVCKPEHAARSPHVAFVPRDAVSLDTDAADQEEPRHEHASHEPRVVQRQHSCLAPSLAFHCAVRPR